STGHKGSEFLQARESSYSRLHTSGAWHQSTTAGNIMRLTITGFISLTVQASLASGCPPGLIPCGATGCCDPNGPLFHQFCADPSCDLCCLSNKHASNGKCCH